MKRVWAVYILCISSIFAFSCRNNTPANETEIKELLQISQTEVDTIHLKRATFSKEIISNGIVKCINSADLKFRTSGIIKKIYVNNGDIVKIGDTIAQLDTKFIELEVDKNYTLYKKAILDFNDILVGYGYGNDTTNIPKELLNIAKIRSGLLISKNNYEVSLLNLKSSCVIAPYNGIIANLEIKEHEFYNNNTICTILNNSKYKVDFNLLEGEINYVKKGDCVYIQPYSDNTIKIKGIVKEINPIINDNGQISLSAILSTNNLLIDGMKVKVRIAANSREGIVMPKSAVVLRNGRDVLFVYNKEREEAEWKYVNIIDSNSNSYLLDESKAELTNGDAIIIWGNLNLSNNSKVVIR